MNPLEQSQSGIQEAGDGIQEAGEAAEPGSFACAECSLPLSLDHPGELPRCSNCGGTRFRRASIFEQPTVRQIAIRGSDEGPEGWLDETRGSIERPGKYLAFYAGGRPRLIELGDGWSRVGRSSSAEIHLDDPTVSRRHAVIVRTPEGELRALDDRSTNGIQVNGEVVDWSPLVDGDELQVGRYRLNVIETAGSGRD